MCMLNVPRSIGQPCKPCNQIALLQTCVCQYPMALGIVHIAVLLLACSDPTEQLICVSAANFGMQVWLPLILMQVPRDVTARVL